MKTVDAKYLREFFGIEGPEPFLDFLEQIEFRAATADGETWTVDWVYGPVAHIDCKGGSFEDVWKRFMRNLVEYRVNGQPIVRFTPEAYKLTSGGDSL